MIRKRAYVEVLRDVASLTRAIFLNASFPSHPEKDFA
jgi:hypothetical protein